MQIYKLDTNQRNQRNQTRAYVRKKNGETEKKRKKARKKRESQIKKK